MREGKTVNSMVRILESGLGKDDTTVRKSTPNPPNPTCQMHITVSK